MLKRRPDVLAMLVALVGSLAVLSILTFDLLASREKDLDDHHKRLSHFSIMLAEHTARTFEAIDILLREIATDLSTNHLRWREWEPTRGWEYVAQRHSRALPQLRDIILFDEGGNQRFISTYFPAPHINVADRPYFSALRDEGLDVATYGPYVGRNSGRYTFALARRIRNGLGEFAGASFAAIEPAYFQEFCWGNRLSDDFEAILINRQGKVITSCRPTDLSRNAPFVGTVATEHLFQGRLKGFILPESGVFTQAGIQISISEVPHFADLRIVALQPVSGILSRWRQKAVEFGILAGLVVGGLIFGGWLIWRRTREMHSNTKELARQREILENNFARATEEIALQKASAERANHAKSRFLAAASHDLRQPLHALSLFAADLQRQVRAGNMEELPRIADQIRTSSSVLGELLDSLLDISRLDMSSIQINAQPFPVQQLFERLATSYQRSAQSQSQRLIFRPTRLIAETDPTLVERLLANLLSNALRYSPDNGTVLVAARRRGKRISLEVRDNGIGIPPEHQTAIFGEFFQVGNTAREARKGLGLGLSIVDRLSRALNCPVSLRSQPGYGTVFAVSLPQGTLYEAPTSSNAPLVESSSTILFLGEQPAVSEALRLAENWSLPCQRIIAPQALGPADKGLICVVDAAELERLPHLWLDLGELIILGESAPASRPNHHRLTLPLRPAKFRALLEQLRKSA